VTLKVKMHKEDGYIWAEVAGVPGLVTQGSTVEEMAANLSEAISAYFDIAIKQPDEQFISRAQTIMAHSKSIYSQARTPLGSALESYRNTAKVPMRVPVRT
jgi:predicted RNase H-like HicB family nuclease